MFNKKYYEPLCKALSERPYVDKLTMWAYSRIDTVRRPDLLKTVRAGVGKGPTSNTSIPIDINPDVNAGSNIYPDNRVSLLITTLEIEFFFLRTIEEALANLRTFSGVSGYLPTSPLIPSVPNSLINDI